MASELFILIFTQHCHDQAPPTFGSKAYIHLISGTYSQHLLHKPVLGKVFIYFSFGSRLSMAVAIIQAFRAMSRTLLKEITIRSLSANNVPTVSRFRGPVTCDKCLSMGEICTRRIVKCIYMQKNSERYIYIIQYKRDTAHRKVTNAYKATIPYRL